MVTQAVDDNYHFPMFISLNKEVEGGKAEIGLRWAVDCIPYTVDSRVKSGMVGQTVKFGKRSCLFHSSIGKK